MDQASMRTRLASARVARLATVTPERQAHVVPCCFVLTDDTVWSAVDAKPKTTQALRRLENLRAHPMVSLVVDHYEEDWDRLWWVRVDGPAHVLSDGDERERALDHLAGKYPQYVERRPPGPVIAISIATWRSWP